MAGKILLEVCVASVEGAIIAQANGADRVELCSAMREGGATPSAATLALSRTHLKIPLNVLIRPRGGDFLYSETEFAVMKRDIAYAKDCGADGIVIGMLTSNGRMDRARMAELIACARPLSVTCHRAFDMSRDPFEALEDLVALGVERILTSGQQPTALAGVKTLAALVEAAKERICIMPGGGITEQSIRPVLEQSGATEVHVFPRIHRDSAMEFRNASVSMSGDSAPDEYGRTEISAERVRAFADAIRCINSRDQPKGTRQIGG
jgi:copper homeostasis protein